MKKILFVDDESPVLDGIRRALRADRNRWQMHFAVGAEAALAACEAEEFDVVVSDLRMPGMDGAALLAIVRERWPGAARIVLSGHADAALSARAAALAYCSIGKPCEDGTLRATLERVLTMQDIFGRPELRRIVGSIGKLPSLSRTYRDLSEAIDLPEVTVKMVAGIVEQDIAMTAKVLQLINSGFFGRANGESNIQNAVSYLGISRIKNVVLASDAFRVFVPSSGVSKETYDKLHLHAHRSAVIATTLPLNAKTREIVVLASLLKDIGELVLATRLEPEFNAIRAMVQEQNCLQVDAEEGMLGVSHAEIGAYLLGLWSINSEVVEAVANHHHPIRIAHAGFDCAAAVYVADLLATELEKNPDDVDGKALHEGDRFSLEQLNVLSLYPAMRLAADTALKARSS